MKILITGICGFVGSVLALELPRHLSGLEIIGLDNLSRSGSEQNRHLFKRHGVRFVHADIRNPSDLEALPKVDWIIDAAANPSVLAGVSEGASSRQLIEHNLVGTLHLLEYCKRHSAGFIMLSTSRVYSLAALTDIPVDVVNDAFVPKPTTNAVTGFSARGVSEKFSTQPPLSLYGAAKLASETMILEYGAAFDLPVHINRCGVLAGAGQFGKPDQGIFSFWIHSCLQRRPLKYIGFGGSGHQTRDCLHPSDLAPVLVKQVSSSSKRGKVLNFSGGMDSAMSLAQLSEWCAARFGPHEIGADPMVRRFDVPWLVLDSHEADAEWGWRPTTKRETILEEIADHAKLHPEWLELSRDA